MNLHYQYSIANVWWNKNAQDQPLFKNAQDLNNYFDSVRTQWSDLSNFVIKDNVETETYFDAPETITINEVLNYHYFLVRELDDNNQQVRILHYFAEISQDSGNRYYARLERDIIIDYYILGEFRERPYTMIYRTHLDRFLYENNTFKYNGKKDSPLYIAEDINAETPECSHLTEINLNVKKSDNRYQYKCKEWIYIYCKFPSDHPLYNPYYEHNINMGYTLLVFPYEYDETNYPDSVSYLRVSSSSLRWSFNVFMEKYQNIKPYIINIRLSLLSPFGTLENSTVIEYDQQSVNETHYNVISGSLLTFGNRYGISTYNPVDNVDQDILLYIKKGNEYSINGMLISDKLKNILNFDNYNLSKQFIVGQRDYKKEPKLFNGIIKSFINSGNIQGNEYNLLDILYHQNDNATYTLKESNVPGITRYYHGFYLNNSLYNYDNLVSLKQNNVSIDTTIPFAEDQYETYLAQNKNFYQMKDLNRYYTGAKNLIGGFTDVMGSAIKLDVGGTINGIKNLAFSGGDIAVDYKNQEYQVDNLRNAPTNPHNLDGNYLMLEGLKRLTPRFEIWQPLKSNLDKICDYLFFNGYTFNKLGKLSDYDSTRKYFNYIQADINGLCYNMNERAYQLLRNKLMVGVRFWHVEPCNVNFANTDNYETWVDEIEESGV